LILIEAIILLNSKFIPKVIVELPILPNTEDYMRKLLLELNKLDIFGINFCELICTPWNKNNLKDKGYALKTNKFSHFFECFNPYEIPISGSEEECFNLLKFAIDKRLRIGIHYCSFDNFRTQEINQRIHVAEKIKKPYEAVTKYGLLKKLVIHSPDCSEAYNDLKRNGVSEKEISILPEKNRLETHVNNIIYLKKGWYEAGILYSLPQGIEVDVRALRGRKAFDGDVISSGKRKQIESMMLMNKGRFHMSQKNYHEAGIYFEKALSLSSKKEKPNIYFYLLQCYKNDSEIKTHENFVYTRGI